MDKRTYRGVAPTCHDINQYSASLESVRIAIGFTAGQVQIIDVQTKESLNIMNEDVSRVILQFKGEWLNLCYRYALFWDTFHVKLRGRWQYINPILATNFSVILVKVKGGGSKR